ncbi:MAG: hypothetical protein K2W95_16065 [Candidatus Obscuribacterales bacterium]|nr:hypothetical protein [Candidatus Obscuribacterales bacterium]
MNRASSDSLKIKGKIALAIVAVAALLTWFYWPPTAAKTIPQLPWQFSMSEHTWNLGHVFDIQGTDGTTYGTIENKWFRSHSTFHYYDNDGNLVAYGRKAWFSIGTRIEVYDANDTYIGCLQKQVLSSAFSFGTIYSVLDAKGNEVATSRKLTIITTGIDLYGKDGAKVASLSRPLSLVADTWNVTVDKPDVIDSRMLVMIGVFKTMADSGK